MADDKGIEEELKIEEKDLQKRPSVPSLNPGASTMKNNFVEKATARGQHDTDEAMIKYQRRKSNLNSEP